MLVGKKVVLRAVEKRDIETLRQWRNHPDLFGYHFSAMLVSEIGQIKWYENSESSNTIPYIIDNEQREPIGYTLLKDIDHKNRNVEIGLHLDPQYQGKGYGKDAFVTLIHYCFRELNMHRVSLEVFAFNERAIQLYKNLGFIEEGRLRDAFFTQMAYHDIVVMSLLETEYQQHYELNLKNE